MKWYKQIVFLLVMMVAAWSAVSLEIQNVDTDAGTLDIYMINDEPVGGFQFKLLGIDITGASAPDGFIASTSSTSVLAFSLTGATIPAGEGILTQVSFISFNGESICFGEDTGSSGGTAISDGSGNYIAADWGACYGTNIYGCTDIDACNYDSDANVDDGSCELPMENYDCDGNCMAIDCAGECGGSAEQDECNVCNGDGAIFECGCSDIVDGACDCDGNVLDNCEVCGGNNSSCSGCTDNSICTYGNCACNYDASATIDNGSCNYPLENFDCDGECLLEDGCNDCFGIQNGTAEIDDCNTCIDCSQYEEDCTQHPAWNQSCTDCAEELNGNAFIDPCGDCVAGTTGIPACLIDCEGGFGFGSFDNCEVCDDDFANDCEIDCNGNWGGTALIDNCGHCVDGNTGEEACVQDCNDDWGGTAEIDNCNVCDGDNSCLDCNGVANGSSWVSECGCVASDNLGDECDDCAGIPNGDSWGSDCGCVVADNSGDDCDDCNGVANGSSWVSECGCVAFDNLGDECDDCAGTPDGGAVEDECGVCGGGGIADGDCDCNGNVDLGCGCGEDGPSGCDNACGSTLEEDECGVCGGDNTSCTWTNLTAEVQELNDIHLSWDPFVEETNRRSSGNRNRDCSSEVCLSIENVDTDAGTLDIYMVNSEEVGGFSFQLFGATIDGAGGGSAEDNGFIINTQAETYNAETDTQLPNVLSFSLTGATIPAGEGVLVSVSFSNFEGSNFCFGESELANTVSDSGASSLSTTWGECICPVDLDECGVCGGNNVPMTGTCDCVGVPDGSAYLDHCDDCVGGDTGDVGCVGDCSTSEGLCDGNWLDGECWGGTAYLDNCDECIGGGTGLEECAADCYGVINGGAVEDECGECEGPGGQVPCWCLGIENNYDNIDVGDCMACTEADCPLDPALSSYYVYRNGLGIPIAQVQSAEYIDEDLDYNDPYCYTVTYIQVQDGTESGHSNVVCKMTDSIPSQDDAPELYGCMSSYACNYLIPGLECGTDDTPDCPIVDDGSCWFKAPGCDCDFDNDGQDDPGAVPDMCGVCGGSGYFDHCGTCDADSSNDCIQDCAGFWDGDLIGEGVYECVSVGDEENNPSDYDDEADCEAEGLFWLQIGNDLCGDCDGGEDGVFDSSCKDDCGEPNGTCEGSGCTFCDGTNDPEDFVDCGVANDLDEDGNCPANFCLDEDLDEDGNCPADFCFNSEGEIICETDEDNWEDSFGDGIWGPGEEYTDENHNGKYDAELCDECADCLGNADGTALMETVNQRWIDFWDVYEPQCCESGDLDICGVCDGLGRIYECGCVGLPIDDDPASPTFGNQACSCDANLNGEWDIEDDCGTCGGSNYFMRVDSDLIPTDKYCDEGDGWVVNNETDELESCVLVDGEDGTTTNFCDCAETEANECGLCIAEYTGEDSSEDQECCDIYKDCAGVCYGDAKVNPCGECWGGTLGECSLNWNNAADCEDELNGECTVSTWFVDVVDTLATELNTIELCENLSGDGINIIGECLIDSNWAAQWDHDGIDTTDTIVILNEADCTIGECSVSMWDLNGDGEKEDVTNEADCLSISECDGYTGTAAISSSSACTCLGYEWTQKGTWYNAEWFSSEWIVGEWTPFLENDLPECLEAECGSDEFECEDAGGEWYIGLCYGDAPKLGCNDKCSNNPLENDCNDDCGGPNGDGTIMPEANECGDCVLLGDNNDVTCEFRCCEDSDINDDYIIVTGEGCTNDGSGNQYENGLGHAKPGWSAAGHCKEGRCRAAECRSYNDQSIDYDNEQDCVDNYGVWFTEEDEGYIDGCAIGYLGGVLEDYNTQDDCESGGGFWYGTDGEVLSDDNEEECEICTDDNEDGTCDDEDEVIGIWYPESGTILDYDNKPDCEDIEQGGGGKWVRTGLVKDDCGECGGTDHLGESVTFEDENSVFYGQCSCEGECFEERITLDCEGSCGGSAQTYTNDYGADGLPATDELEADEGEGDGIEEEFCCGSGNYDCTDVCDGPLTNICIGGSNENASNQILCEILDGYWSENGDDACGECGEDNVFIYGDSGILSTIYGCENFDLGDGDTNEAPDTEDGCETLNGEWGLMGSPFEMLNAYGECDCAGNKLDCDGVCAGSNQSSGDCVEGGNGNYCSISDMDECGICYGEDIFDSDGLLPDSSCDCYKNKPNCAGECPTISDPDNLGEWISNPDWEPISGVDVDGDGICDDIDDCVSNPLNNKHLFYKCDIDAELIEDGICSEANLSVALDPDGNRDTKYGGYDTCGICNGNGFSCGFEVGGGVNEIKLSWRKPYNDQFDSTLFATDSTLFDTTLGRSNSNTMGSFESYSLFSSSGGNTDTSPGSLEIENVNIDAGTLDIVLTSIPNCSYCENSDYNNNTIDWQEKKQLCELQSTWIINTNITKDECAEIPGFMANIGGWWYDGHIGGYQFTLTGITISDATAPEGFDVSSLASTITSGASTLLGFSLSGATIPPGIGILLTTISFDVTDEYAENGICFVPQDCSQGETTPGSADGACRNVISDAIGGSRSTDWGGCFCPVGNPVDICGVCGGKGLELSCEEEYGPLNEGTYCDCDCNKDLGCGCGEDAPLSMCPWAPEIEVCFEYDCPPDPDAVSFNVYRENAAGDLVLEEEGLRYNHYTHKGLGWEEAYTYAISYTLASYTLDSLEYFSTAVSTSASGRTVTVAEYDDNQNPENAERILGVTDAEVLGCIYPSSCAYDNENPANTYLENSCWWPTYACDCESPQYSVVDECGECGGDSSSCFDCAGTPNGSASVDNCDTCDADNANDCTPDCSGEWGGVSVEDECGVCEGDGTSCLSLYNGLIPDEYSIHNIYPNPFNPYANIIYGIPELSNVKVTVYDLQGRQIAVLQNDIQTPGYYAIQWDAAQYSSGVYFIEMLSDDFRQIKRVLHMK